MHCPLICTKVRALNDLSIIKEATHLIFTSKSSVRHFVEVFGSLSHIQGIYAVGKATGQCAYDHFGIKPLVAEEETAEGVVDVLRRDPPKESAFVVWPHAAGARSVISDYLLTTAIRHFCFVLYDTHFIRPKPLPALETVDEIFFTSPSTIDAFLQAYGTLPVDKKLRTIGPVTEAHLVQARKKCRLSLN